MHGEQQETELESKNKGFVATRPDSWPENSNNEAYCHRVLFAVKTTTKTTVIAYRWVFE